METKTKKIVLIGVAVLALAGVGIYLYIKNKKPSLSDAPAGGDSGEKIPAPGPAIINNIPAPTENSTIKDIVAKPKVIIPLNATKNANIYNITYVGKQSRVGRLSRIVKTQNENIGYFVRFVSIDGQDYVVFGDKVNGNKPSLILKSQTNYYNK